MCDGRLEWSASSYLHSFRYSFRKSYNNYISSIILFNPFYRYYLSLNRQQLLQVIKIYQLNLNKVKLIIQVMTQVNNINNKQKEYELQLDQLMNGQIDQLVNNRLSAYIQQVLAKQNYLMQSDQSDRAEIDIGTFVMELVKNYNQANDYWVQQLHDQQIKYQQQALHKQSQFSTAIQELETKLEQLTTQYEQQLTVQAQQHSVKIEQVVGQHQCKLRQMSLRIEQQQAHISNLNEELQRKTNIISQYVGKLGKLQHMIQKYEYQLHEKTKIITNFQNQLQIAIYESQQAQHRMKQFGDNMMALFDQQVWVSNSQLYEQPAQYLQTAHQFIGFIASQQIDVHNLTASNQSITQFQVEQTQLWQYPSVLPQMKQKCKLVEGTINKLVVSHRQQTIKNQNLSHKYAQFLKETQTKFQECKIKIKDLQTDKMKLQQVNENLTNQLMSKEAQMNKLLEHVKTSLESHKQSNTTLQNKLRSMQQQLETKKQTIQQLQQDHKRQNERMDKHIQSLTLQIQSLRESISTLKNVVRLPKDQPHQPIDAMVVQQMIDKTYEIRLENAKLKNYVNQIKTEYEQQGINYDKLSNDKAKIEAEFNQIKDQTKSLKQQIKKLQLEICRQKQISNNLNTQKQSDKQQYQAKYSQLKFEIGRLQQQVKKLTQQLQSNIEEKQKLIVKLQDLSFQSQINSKIEQMSNIGLISYERMEIQQLQIFVLNSIITNLKSEISRNSIKPPIADQEVQVDLQPTLDPEEFDPHQKSAETIRNTRSRAASSVGCLINIKKVNKQLENQKQNAVANQSQLQNLNKTCKIRTNSTGEDGNFFKNQIEQLNDLVNYMINYLKGYTRNGVRKQCWIASQGDDYMLKIQNPKNIKQKYGTFERVRTLMNKNQACKQLVRDYEKIANFYFASLASNSLDSMPTVGHWESFQKPKNNEESWSTHNKTKCLYSK